MPRRKQTRSKRSNGPSQGYSRAYKKKYPKRYVKKKVLDTDLTSGIISGVKRFGGSALGGLGSTAGRMIGNAWFPGLGDAIMEGYKYFTGKGSYSVKENVFLDPSFSHMTPIVNKDPGGGVVIRRAEYLGDIISSSNANTFQLQNFFINPGLSATFPWLSGVASNFDEWVIEGMYFEFRSMSSDSLNSTNTALGTVILAANYNSTQTNFASKIEMENYEGGVSVKPSESVRYFVECAKNRTVLTDLYVRTGEVPAGQDQRFYDLANFQIATTGMQGTSVNLGELWVCYQVSLRKPKLVTLLGGDIGFLAMSNNTGVAAGTVFGTLDNISYDTANTIDILFVGSNTFSLPPSPAFQTYIITIRWSGGSASCVFPSVTYGAGIQGFTEYQAPLPASTATTSMVIVLYALVVANTSATTIAFGTAGTLPTTPSVAMLITQVPNTFEG